jgi:hypothetical protein
VLAVDEHQRLLHLRHAGVRMEGVAVSGREKSRRRVQIIRINSGSK